VELRKGEITTVLHMVKRLYYAAGQELPDFTRKELFEALGNKPIQLDFLDALVRLGLLTKRDEVAQSGGLVTKYSIPNNIELRNYFESKAEAGVEFNTFANRIIGEEQQMKNENLKAPLFRKAWEEKEKEEAEEKERVAKALAAKQLSEQLAKNLEAKREPDVKAELLPAEKTPEPALTPAAAKALAAKEESIKTILTGVPMAPVEQSKTPKLDRVIELSEKFNSSIEELLEQNFINAQGMVEAFKGVLQELKALRKDVDAIKTSIDYLVTEWKK
jgi:hypothetical protein